MMSAIEMASIEAHGPSTTAAMPTPIACPVVPPGSGRLNIMMTKEKAANRDSSSTRRVCRSFFTRRSPVYQKGAEPAYKEAHVAGLRYPSGICMSTVVRVYQSCHAPRKFGLLSGRGIPLHVIVHRVLPPPSGPQIRELLRILQPVFRAQPRVVAESDIFDIRPIRRIVAAAENR